MKSTDLRVAFLGTPRFAEIVLRELASSSFRPGLVVTEPDKRAGRGRQLTASAVKTASEQLGLPLAQPDNRAELEATLSEYQPDLIIVAAYGRLLRPEILAIPKKGILNIHGSLLPKYRGASPIQSALLADEAETGVTIMEIDEGLDTGAMVAWATLPIEPTDTTQSLMEKLAELGAAALIETLPGYLDGSIVPIEQDNTQASTTTLINKIDGRLTGAESPKKILAMLRAFTPWPGVWFELNEQRVLLLEAAIEGGQLEPKKLQLAGKQATDWQTFKRDRQELAQKILGFLNQ